MKIKIVYVSLVLLSISICLVGCTKENDLEDFEQESFNTKQKLLKETSLLIGNVLTDKNIKEELNNIMKGVSKDGDIVSFAYLFGKEASLRKNEITALKNKSINLDVFRNALAKELNENRNDYEELSKYVNGNSDSNNISKTSESTINDLEDLLVTEQLQIFYPYDPEYADDDMTVTDFYVSFDPLDGSQTNMGYKFDEGSSDGEIVNDLDNNFLDENPVYLVVPIDPCDITGQPCLYTDLQPSEKDPLTDEILPYDDDQLFADGNVGGGNTGGGNTGGGTNDPPTTELLTTNTDHEDIPESDIISSYIPRIQINGTSWMGFAGTHQKLRFFRATGDGDVTQNSNGTITAGGSDYLIKYYRCKRKFVRKKYWVDINAEFDPDWNMSENTQSMAIFSVHHLSASASIEVNAKSGFKLEGGEIKPSAEAIGTLKITISTGSAKYRANAEMSRRFILATIVGNGTSGQTFSDNGVDYNVKSIGIVKYYMKHFYTDL